MGEAAGFKDACPTYENHMKSHLKSYKNMEKTVDKAMECAYTKKGF